MSKNKLILSAITIASMSVVACGSYNHTRAKVDVVNTPQTQVKWQSIGNCWTYAFAGWAESVVLGATNNTQSLNISESYITYKHYEGQIKSGANEVTTGGFFQAAQSIVLRNGYLDEGDFVPSESDVTFSAVQKQATAYLNTSLKSGLLSKDRSAATVTQELEKAFGVNSAEFSKKIKSFDSLPGGVDSTGRKISLTNKLNSMKTLSWAGNSAQGRKENEVLFYNPTRTAAEKAVLKRVMTAMNAGHAVVMDWFVDFNALASDGIFSGEELLNRGSGRQGYHSTVLEDYVVSIKNEDGSVRIIGEGEASDADKKLAAEKGEVLYFVLKNSWGGDERKDRPSYVREGKAGYTRLNASYLFAAAKVLDEKTGEYSYHDEVVQSFHIPTGF